MGALLLVPLLGPLAAAAVAAVAGWSRPVAGLAVAAAAGQLACGAVLAGVLPGHGPIAGLGGVLRADALTALLLVVIGGVGVLAAWGAVHHVRDELAEGVTDAPGARGFGVLLPLFLAAMAAAVLADDLGVTWVAIEATTIITAFLVGHRRTRTALEAAWKYVIVCSAGIALAFLGTVLLYFAARHADLDTLRWSVLAANADRLDPDVVRLAGALVLLGFGTKAGLAPVHAWLPDAHSQAPAPVSALMSGVLLAVSFTAVLRHKVVVDAAVGPGFLRVLLLVAALLSLAVAAALLLAQRDYKRLLAYSSIEHMGLLALGAAAGGTTALAAVLLHMLGHGLGKSALFLIAGRLLRAERTSRIDAATGLLARRPALGVLLALGLAAIAGLPPFSLFASEVRLVLAAFAGLGWAVAVALALLLVAVAAVAAHGARMLLGPAEPIATAPAPRPVTGLAPAVVGLAACALLGVWAGPLLPLLDAAAAVAAGGPQ